MTDLTHNPDRYPHNGGNADTDLLCRACELGVPVKRAMPGPPECECATSKTGLTVYTLKCQLHSPFGAARLALRPPKRITDAEAAAEYWRAATASERVRAVCAITRDPGECITTNVDFLRVSREQVTWHRFAALPHALEVEA